MADQLGAVPGEEYGQRIREASSHPVMRRAGIDEKKTQKIWKNNEFTKYNKSSWINTNQNIM